MVQLVRNSVPRCRGIPSLGHLLVCLIVVPLPVACSRSKPGAGPDKDLGTRVTMVAEDDPDMQAAIANARSTLPLFWKTFEKPQHGEKTFSVKAPVKDENGTEYFWLVSLQRKGNKVSGTINNPPEIVKSVKLGQRVEVAEDQIADWTFLRNGKIVGNYTLRPLMKTMPEDEAAKLRSLLEEP